MTIIRTENISKTYSGHTALNGIDLSIPENSVFGLLGPNGAGKTSLIRILTQIIAPDKGQVFFKEEKLSPRHISNMGYLPEERGLYKRMKVGEQLIYLGRLKGLSLKNARVKLKYWLDKLDLSPWEGKNIEDLSKGMQQKVQFIATVMHDPELIILDEPFSGFDPINADLIKNEILEFKKRGASIILSTHRMESVEELCDHIALFNRSEKILQGSIQEIQQQFKKEIYLVEGRGVVRETEKIKLVTKENLNEDKVRLRIKAEKEISSNDLLKELMTSMEVLVFKEEIPSINDIFILKVKGENE